MGTALYDAQPESIVEQLIRPAILKLLRETDGSYRCERDLHHHFTVCLNGIKALRLGTQQRLVYLEHPGKACYGSGRDGNLDYFFPERNPTAAPLQRQSGAAMELNSNYDSSQKITRDVQKLIDPQNGYKESAYFAFGRKPRFFESLRKGIGRAFGYFAEDRADFRLPPGLHIFVVEGARDARGHLLREALVKHACIPDELEWIETVVERHASPQPEAGRKVALIDRKASSDIDGLYLDRASAQDLLISALVEAKIPLESTSARCMFEATRNSSGQARCKLRMTPLWENELRIVEGRVLRSEFMDWVNRLCDSGHAFQKAGRASWKN
jgi:hypothetical protein